MLLILLPLLKLSQVVLLSFGLWSHLAVADRVEREFIMMLSLEGMSSVTYEAGKLPEQLS